MPAYWPLFAALALLVCGAVAYVAVRIAALGRAQRQAEAQAQAQAEARHRGMLSDLHEGLARLADRMGAAQLDAGERVRGSVAQDALQTRDAMQALQLEQTQSLGALRADLGARQDALKAELLGGTMERLAEQSRAERELVQTTLSAHSLQLTQAIEALTRRVDERLEQIAGRVGERLDEGFRKTNETFVSVMARLATIDEAQKKIDGLTSNVVSLQELLGDKRARGAFGEVQLEALVGNILPPGGYAFQHTLSNQTRVDCVLKLPAPTGMVPVDSKFPLENYRKLVEAPPGSPESAQAVRAFKLDVKGHIDAIASKYIIHGETSDGAVMFVPAEAVFAEIHAHHSDLVELAMQRRVWIVSPTTLMAVLNTARAVMKDTETRLQVHVIKDELGKLARDFARFDERMAKLAQHIGQVHTDVEEVHKSSVKITRRFQQIERVELDEPVRGATLRVVEGPDE
jgi:DNA recombination protein RmuC